MVTMRCDRNIPLDKNRGFEAQCRFALSTHLTILTLCPTVPLMMIKLGVGRKRLTRQFRLTAMFVLLSRADTGGQIPVLEFAIARLSLCVNKVNEFTKAL